MKAAWVWEGGLKEKRRRGTGGRERVTWREEKEEEELEEEEEEEEDSQFSPIRVQERMYRERVGE